MRKPHSLSEAETSRDSFSKALYDRLFTWIVGHVNAAIDPALTEAAADDTVIRISLLISTHLLKIFSYLLSFMHGRVKIGIQLYSAFLVQLSGQLCLKLGGNQGVPTPYHQ